MCSLTSLNLHSASHLSQNLSKSSVAYVLLHRPIDGSFVVAALSFGTVTVARKGV